MGSIGPKVIKEVIISHAHADHIMDISFLHPSIRLNTSPITSEILTLLDTTSGNNSEFRNILKYKPLFEKNSATYDWTVEEAKEFTKRTINIMNIGLEHLFLENSLTVTPFYVDHSIPGATAFLIMDKISGAKIVYTGDLRLHGIAYESTKQFIHRAKEFQPDVLICEGTRLDPDEERMEQATEVLLLEKLIELVEKISNQDGTKLIMFECSPRDGWRLRSFYIAAMANNKTLVLNAKAYLMLDLMVRNKLVDDIDLDKIRVYLPRKDSGKYLPKDYIASNDIAILFAKDPSKIPLEYYKTGDKKGLPKEPSKWQTIDLDLPIGIKADEIRANPGQYILYLPFYSLMELADLVPPPQSFYIISKSAPFDDEMLIDEEKRKNWFELMDIPKSNVFQLHCSGHLRKEDLISMIKEIHPKVVVPIHTNHQEEFLKMGLEAEKIQIRCLKMGETYSIS
jgi:ribonuclease J